MTNGLPELPVGFTVKLVSADEDGSRFLGGVQQDQVGGYALIGVHFDDIAYFDGMAGDLRVFVLAYERV